MSKVELTAFSYFALILIDNSHLLENPIPPNETKKSEEFEKSETKHPSDSVMKESRGGEKSDTITNESNSFTKQPSDNTTEESRQWKVGEYQEIALKSLALIFNISFVLGLSGMILSLLSKSGISFVDKLIEKIIENAMGSGAGGASSFFSIPTLLSASVATTIGVAAVNAYQIPQVQNPNADSNIAETIKLINDKLQQDISLSKNYQSSIEAFNLSIEEILNKIDYLSTTTPGLPKEYYDLSSKIKDNETITNSIRDEINKLFKWGCDEYNNDPKNKNKEKIECINFIN